MGIVPTNVEGNNWQRRPLLRRDIETAQSQTKSGHQAAIYLNVSYPTYKKYAKMYDLFDVHKRLSGKGIPRSRIQGTHGLDSILAGNHPNYDRNKLKIRLIKAAYLPEECSMCGYCQKRVVDGKCPLVLHNKDGNNKNFSLENLELRCYNCTYLTTGNIVAKDPLQGVDVSQDLILSGKVTMDDIEAIQNEFLNDS
jgi:hypothetical protein